MPQRVKSDYFLEAQLTTKLGVSVCGCAFLSSISFAIGSGRRDFFTVSSLLEVFLIKRGNNFISSIMYHSLWEPGLFAEFWNQFCLVEIIRGKSCPRFWETTLEATSAEENLKLSSRHYLHGVSKLIIFLSSNCRIRTFGTVVGLNPAFHFEISCSIGKMPKIFFKIYCPLSHHIQMSYQNLGIFNFPLNFSSSSSSRTGLRSTIKSFIFLPLGFEYLLVWYSFLLHWAG